MSRWISTAFFLTAATALGLAIGAFAQPPAQEGRGAQKKAPAVPRPPLFFHEDWKQPPHEGNLTDANRKATQNAVTNANLELKIYGPCKEASVLGPEVYGTPNDTIFPMNLWTGMCPSPVAVTLRDRNNYVDLTGPSRIKWVTRAANLHAVRPVIRLADGTLLVGTHTDVTPPTTRDMEPDMVESEFSLAAVRWFRIDPEKISVNRPADNPDLSKVDEVGFADLMPGGGHGNAGWINVGPFEVYGKAVKR